MTCGRIPSTNFPTIIDELKQPFRAAYRLQNAAEEELSRSR
jgi:hypothetical protein